ncbi:methionine--tRNA ligase [bacterium BMS3Bbin02]|nr:methionine--tRNA ligase [bacterium BMS3Bbin02]
MSRYYVTTAIPYVNASPHLGHALEFVQADVLARSRRLAGDDVRFLSGTDDNALKNVLAAEVAGVSVAEYVRTHADEFEALGRTLGLSLDDYIRTSTDPRHRPGVERLWRATAASGDLYVRDYEGLYCVGCEQFYQSGDLVEGRCPEHLVAPEVVAERNWFFRLSRYAGPLLEAIDSGQLRIEPEPRRKEVIAFIRSGLEDISVSRSTERARGWGIAVPDDPGQVIYVWYDALGNYITALGYGTNQTDYRSWWLDSDHRVHVIGKGILRFHAVYWPAFLLSAGEPLPTAIYVHDYLTIDGAKISKSSGNIIDPADLVADYGTDALRWWLTSDVPTLGETNFTRQRLVDRANRDLANGYGNLVNRIGALIDKYRPEGCPPAPTDDPLLDQAAKTRIDVHEALDRFDIRAAALAVRNLIRAANTYIQHHRPWEQAKADPSRQDFDHTIGCLNSVVLTIADLLQIFTPDLAGKAIARIEGTTSDVLFPRLEHKPSDATSHRTDC